MKAAVKLARKAYELYFGRNAWDEAKVWAPRIYCSSCSRAII